MAKLTSVDSYADLAGGTPIDYSQGDVGQKGSTRRTFLSYAIGAISGLIALVIGIPSVRYVVSPALKKKEKEWVRVGSIRKVEIGVPTLFKTRTVRQVGWEKTVSEDMMYAFTEDGESFAVLSNVCTHLGCRTHWDSGKNAYFCPCHAGVFDKEGRVVSGPPPRPLDRYEVKIEDGVLYIGELYSANDQLEKAS